MCAVRRNCICISHHAREEKHARLIKRVLSGPGQEKLCTRSMLTSRGGWRKHTHTCARYMRSTSVYSCMSPSIDSRPPHALHTTHTQYSPSGTGMGIACKRLPLLRGTRWE